MRVGRAAEESVSPPRGSGGQTVRICPRQQQLCDHNIASKLGLDGRLGIGKAVIINVVRRVFEVY